MTVGNASEVQGRITQWLAEEHQRLSDLMKLDAEKAEEALNAQDNATYMDYMRRRVEKASLRAVYGSAADAFAVLWADADTDVNILVEASAIAATMDCYLGAGYQRKRFKKWLVEAYNQATGCRITPDIVGKYLRVDRFLNSNAAAKSLVERSWMKHDLGVAATMVASHRGEAGLPLDPTEIEVRDRIAERLAKDPPKRTTRRVGIDASVRDLKDKLSEQAEQPEVGESSESVPDVLADVFDALRRMDMKIESLATTLTTKADIASVSGSIGELKESVEEFQEWVKESVARRKADVPSSLVQELKNHDNGRNV